MSDLKGAQLVESFASKMDIEMVSPITYWKMIELTRNTPRVVVCAVGPSGVGKSAIPRQIAKKRKSPYLPLFIPQMPVEDCHIPTSAADTKQYFDRRIPRKFQPVIEYVAKLRDKYGENIPDGMQPIVSIEELNRAKDKHVTQAMFTLLEDRMIGDTYIDPYIQLIVTMNPSGAAFAVNEFERDPACRRRLSLVGVAPSFGDFIRHATEAKFHAKVIAHLEAQPTWFYDYAASLAGKQFPCPASWETVSQVMYALDEEEVGLDEPHARALIAGKIGDAAAQAFVEFAKDNSIVITPDEVLLGYKPDSQVRRRFKEDYLGEGSNEARFDKVDELLLGVALKVFSDMKRDPKKFGPQIAVFMEDLPEEKLKLFVRNLVEQAKLGEEAKRYMRKFNSMLNGESYFQKAAKRLTDAEAKVQTEKQKSGF